MSAKPKARPIQSMTGFCSVEARAGSAEQRFRLEIKALNHRYLDLKLRLPRELLPAEPQLRAALSAAFSRGSLDVKVERLSGSGQDGQQSAHFQTRVDRELAAHYLKELRGLQSQLGLTDPIRTADLAALPDVLSRSTAETPVEEVWSSLEPLARQGIARLTEMREHEGAALTRALGEAIDSMEAQIQSVRARRRVSEREARARIQDKVKAVFDAYPLAESAAAGAQAVLETRVAQELALLIDRTDVEEELVRFQGHLDHFRKAMEAGGPVGRKLEFLLQELGREINTLGNKAQDLQISEEVVQAKVRLEQLREQVMNLE